MVYCHQCGSEISEIDTFCPFCGISLQPINIADDEESDDEIQADSLTTADVNNTETDIDSENNSEDFAEDIDMADTIVVQPETLIKSDKPPSEGGYIDISSLKEDELSEIPSATDSDIEPPEIEKETIISTAEIGKNQDEFELAEEPDISENQADTSDKATDESAEESVEFTPPAGKDLDPETQADKKAIDVVIKTIDEAGSENVADESASDDLKNDEPQIEPIDTSSGQEKDESEESEGRSFKTDAEFSDESNIPSENKVLPGDDLTDLHHKTNSQTAEETGLKNQDETDIKPDQIQAADESEIDDAVSVIDSKVSVWNKEEEILTTGTLKDEEKNESEISEIDSSEITDSATSQSEPEVEAEMLEKSEQAEEISEEIPSAEIISQPEDGGVQEWETNSDELSESDVTTSEPFGEVVEPESENAGQVESVPEDAGQEEPVAVQNENVPKSETTPNMGFGDTDGSNAQKLKPLDEGTVLNGRYEIVRKIGGGGMGAVYLANDKNLGGVLRAVKEMVQSYIEKDQQDKALQDFKRESMLLTSLDHPSIPTIYDYFYEENEARFYLVMKYISGGDLAARLRSAPEGRLDEQSVTDWAFQIADVLDYLHSKNPPIVYRDLKPANIMIDGNTNKVMLIDFGIARWINKEEKGVTAVGTMGYAPPELFSGNVQPASDIYSLGSTMFHLMTGADPQNNPLLIFDFQKHPRPRQINPQLSDQMERILMRAVEYSADKRFGSAAEMKNALEEHLTNLKAGNVSYGIKETPTAISLADQPVFCGFCGQKIVATDMFCAFCGAKQPLSQPGVHSQEYHMPQFTARLVIEGTTDLQYPAFELVKNENLVGRRDPMSNIFPEIDLSKFDPQTKISRKHARIWRDGDKFLIEDLGSSNGTVWISAQTETVRLIPHQTQVLQSGDKIQLGDTTLEFIAG